MTGYALDPCEKCEKMMQPYLDRVLSENERLEAEAHLAGCTWCEKHYRFEESLRKFVRQAVSEEMPAELKAKLVALRTPLM